VVKSRCKFNTKVVSKTKVVKYRKSNMTSIGETCKFLVNSAF